MSGSAKRPRQVAILLFDDVEVLDFAGPFEVFSVTSEQIGTDRLQVFTVAETDGVVRTIGGLTVLPKYSFELSPAPDILIVPGGTGSRREMDNPALMAWVKRIHRDAELVMSVCSGARILARAGLLDGIPVTTHHQVTDHLRELAPAAHVDPTRRYIDAGRIITTGGISAGIDGSFHVVVRLFGDETARGVAGYMEYDWRPDPLETQQGRYRMVSSTHVARILGLRRVRSTTDLRRAVANGLPKHSLGTVTSYVADDAKEAARLKADLIPPATFKRRSGVLKPEEGERIERLARVMALAEAAFGSAQDARRFLAAPHPELDGDRPIDAAKTELGARQIEEILWRMEYGLPV